jgi:Acetoacetate decarboxylase (ADC)
LTAPYACGFIGDGITRVVPLALPSAKVRAWLPTGLELGGQDITPTGTHPVIFLFHGFSHCQFSFPTLLESMNFREQTVGVPFTYLRAHNGVADSSGPYYFMPKLYLDDPWVLMIGWVWWGFNKELAKVDMTADHYTVTSLAGRRLASLAWSAGGSDEHQAVRGFAAFEPIRQMLSQPLITMFPSPGGPLFALTDFDRRWNLAKVRTLQTVLELDVSYMPGFDAARYPASGWSEDDDSSAPGSYELLAPWWLSFPYRPPLPFR